ncbi:hypothetical protein EC988_006049 [Linderina pennispora]|nr:hypothetical protein EC988_006049 [Linderina pennispora]
MPRSFGSDNMLVEISVFREENSGPDVTLHSVDADSPYWYVVGVGAIESVPLLLGKGSCWKSIFRVCPLNRSTTRATAPGLNLLSTTAYTAESPTSVDKSTAYITIHALCSTGDETSHLLDVSQRVQLPTASERELDIVADNYGLESGTAIPTAATDASLSSSRNSMQHRRPSTANTAYGRRSTAVDQIRSPGSKSAVAATFERTSSHMRNVSLDTLAHPTRPSARKLSIAHPQSQNQPEMLSASSMSSQYGGSMTMRRGHLRNSRSSAMGDFEPGSLGRLRGNQVVAEEQQLQADMRGRSATMAAPNLRSPTSPRQAFQRQSLSGVSTLLANSSHPYTQTLPPTLPEVAESRVSAESQKRPGVACASISEPAPDPEASVVDIGTISISFDAPSMAMLGEEFVVRVHISNNTNVHYFRLALLDISRRGEQLAVAEDDDQPDLSPGLLSLDHSTEIPPLRPGESASVALRYIAAEPHFHSIKMLRLLNLDADIADKSLFAIESPFVVFVDDSSR